VGDVEDVAVGDAALDPGESDPSMRVSDSGAFLPLGHDDRSQAWNGSTTSLNTPYTDHDPGMRSSATGMSADIDPYTTRPMHPQGAGYDNRF